MNIHKHIQTLIYKLEQLKEHDPECLNFGASYHKYKAKKVYEKELDHFEFTAPKVRLPEEFKELLLQIGTGVGPEYGLYSLYEMKSEYKEWAADFDVECSMSGLCELTNDLANEIISKRISDPKSNASHYLKTVNGILPLNHEGDTYHCYMVLNGEQTGKIWFLELNGFQTFPADGTREWNVLDWYENWLDRQLPQGERPTEF